MYAKHTLSKNCTFQRASRLRETHIFKIKCRLVYARRYFFALMLSRLRETTTLGGNTEPRPPKPSPAKPTRARKKSCLVYAKRMFTESSQKKSPLVYAKRTLPNASVVSSTRDATFFDKLPSRLRETPTLGGEAEPSPAEPS